MEREASPFLFRDKRWTFPFLKIDKDHDEANQEIHSAEDHAPNRVIERIIHARIGEGKNGDLGEHNRRESIRKAAAFEPNHDQVLFLPLLDEAINGPA